VLRIWWHWRSNSIPGADTLGNIPTAEFGVTTGPNAVNPSGDAASGILRPEQARRFIDYVWDGTVLAKDGRRVTMRANTMELEKVNVGERVIRAAAQGLGSYTNTGATFSKVELTTKKIRLDWEVTSEALEDNIEGAALEDHLVRLMTNAFANDIEDLAINGDGTTGDFLSIMDGFINTATTGDAHEAAVTVTDNAWTPEVMQDIILAMPRKYRALKNNLKFYAGTDAFQGILKNNGTLADAIAEAFAGQVSGTEANARPTLTVLDRHSVEHVQLVFSESMSWRFHTTQQTMLISRSHRTVSGDSSVTSQSTVSMLQRRTQLNTQYSSASESSGKKKTPSHSQMQRLIPNHKLIPNRGAGTSVSAPLFILI
jgi:hypothetical protein